MPIYEYRCESCGEELEKLQKMNDPALKDCPGCGEASLVKLISASSFRLKGTGWYETDFKTGSKKNGVTDGKTEGASESSSAESKDSKKPDSGKTESKGKSNPASTSD